MEGAFQAIGKLSWECLKLVARSLRALDSSGVFGHDQGRASLPLGAWVKGSVSAVQLKLQRL